MYDIVTLVSWGLIILVVLLQFFLALRPFFLWGLIPPLLFAGLWLYFGNGSGNIPILDLPLNQTAMDFYSQVGQLGLLISLIIFVFCRLLLLARERARKKRREQRLAAKRERELRAKIMSGLQDGYAEHTGEFPAPDTTAK